MSLPVGTRLGPYEILDLIGAGGMGEVYRAKHTKLERFVAIKILPGPVAHDPDRLARFEREAKAVASLSHPNILAIHDFAISDGQAYAVTELLEGETLRSRLLQTPLPTNQTIELMQQVASGLAAAHDKGIVHRDLKPDNVFLTRDGQVKILDFGLAKVRGPLPTAEEHTAAVTGPGVLLGTVNYMAPEQVRGEDIDARADLFACGALLYELLTGVSPFQRATAAETLRAILKEDPPELTVGTNTPPLLQNVLRHALEKDPGHRFQSARDFAFQLKLLASVSATTHGIPPQGRGPALKWLPTVFVAAVGLACGAAAMWFVFAKAPRRSDDLPVVSHVARITRDIGFSEWPTWSPDGRTLAFSSNRNGNFEIYVGRLDSREVVNVTGHPSDDVQPAFSPDGASIAFVSTRATRKPLVKIGTYAGFWTRTYGGDVWVTSALGGQARRVAEGGNFPAWAPNGTAIAYVAGDEDRRTIFEAPLDGGPPREILAASASKWEITGLGYAPSGRWLTFDTTDAELMALPLGGGAPQTLLRGNTHAWSPDGRRVYYLQDDKGGTQIQAADVEETSGRLTVTRVRTVGTNTGALSRLSISSDSTHILVADMQESLNLTRVPLSVNGDTTRGPEETLSTGQVRDRYPAVSPDGTRILVGTNRVGEEELRLVDLRSGEWRRVELPRQTFDGVTGCWSKDDRHVIAMPIAEGQNALWLVALDGSSFEQLIPPGAGGEVVSRGSTACAVSPDGRLLVFPRQVGTYTQLIVFDLAARHQRPLTVSPSHKYDAAWSPDGRWIAFSAGTAGGINIWRIPSQGGAEQPLTTGFDRLRHLFYSPDGRWLYVQPNHRNIYRMPADGGPRQAVTDFVDSSSLFIEEPTMSPDGRYLFYNRGHGGSSIWMLTLQRP